MNGDWRLTNQINYLYMLKLKKEAFKKTDRSDHEHCEFCFGKFSENQETYILVIAHLIGITGYAIDALAILKICLNGH